jgi:hypothetical protein
VALAIKLKIAGSVLGDDAKEARKLLAELQADTASAVQNLPDLAHGIYPPLLADLGLVAARNAQAGKSPVPVTMRADGIGAVPAGDRGRRLLLLPRGAAEHRQVRPRDRRAHQPVRRERRADLRGVR